jgi:hypothetical protein
LATPTKSVAQSILIDTAVNHLSVQSSIHSRTDSPELFVVVEGRSCGALAGNQENATNRAVFRLSGNESSFAAGTTGRHAVAPAGNNWLAHSAALQTIVSHSSRNGVDAEAVLDIARHAGVKKHAKELENALDSVLAEEEETCLLECGAQRFSQSRDQSLALRRRFCM